MEDLDKVKTGNLNCIRRNEAARFVGDASLRGSLGGNLTDKYPAIEPSLKDKLTNDQVRINYLREQ